jgi:hypothetical protein
VVKACALMFEHNDCNEIAGFDLEQALFFDADDKWTTFPALTTQE